MKPVNQTYQHKPPKSIGNCFRACIASILELDIDEVPAFEQLPGCWNGEESKEASDCLKNWLADRDLSLSYHPLYTEQIPKGYSILTGTSPRLKGGGHCVVALDGNVVHDPYKWPSAGGLAELWDYCVIIPPAQALVECYPIRILDHYPSFNGYTYLSKAEYEAVSGASHSWREA
jgi:hypothetical protein